MARKQKQAAVAAWVFSSLVVIGRVLDLASKLLDLSV
jgi:hypothetical protein